MPRVLTSAVVLAVVLAASPTAFARPYWKRRIDRLTRNKAMGVSVAFDDRYIYGRDARVKRVPASNQKLLLSMALFDRFGGAERIPTILAARRVGAHAVRSNLWVLGRGDPTIAGKSAFARSLPLAPTRVRGIARAIERAGIRRIEGRVMGSTSYFRRDWFAPGWEADFPRRYVARPTALTFEGNKRRGRHIAAPERRMARALTRALRARGVRVAGEPGMGSPPALRWRVATVRSAPLRHLLTYTNRISSNFFAEVLGKALGAGAFGRPGSIAKGARAIARWCRARGVRIRARDSSGLSYRNRVSPRGLVRLLDGAMAERWGARFRRTLPEAGGGTLRDRLRGVRLRAKTGTLDNASALSGYVWLRRLDGWARFSILSRGMSKDRASDLEDRVVRILARDGR